MPHKEIQKYIYSEFIKKIFKLEEALFKIVKIYNNKIHIITERMSNETKDLEVKGDRK